MYFDYPGLSGHVFEGASNIRPLCRVNKQSNEKRRSLQTPLRWDLTTLHLTKDLNVIMRAPQYGHNKSKKRGAQAPRPAIVCHLPGRGMTHAVGLRGGNEPLPTRPIHYIAPKTALYEDGTYGAPCTMSLHHKSATWVDGVKTVGEGPTVTKRYTVVKNKHRL